jgi:hypothetical protein
MSARKCWRGITHVQLITLLHAEPMVFAGEKGDTPSTRHVTLHEAVRLALQHDHNVHIAADDVKTSGNRTCLARLGRSELAAAD